MSGRDLERALWLATAYTVLLTGSLALQIVGACLVVLNSLFSLAAYMYFSVRAVRENRDSTRGRG